MKTIHKILLLSSLFWILLGGFLLDQTFTKNKKQVDSMDEQIESLNHQIASLKDSVTILKIDAMTQKIDLGRYEVAIDYLEGDCKTKMDEILSHME